MSAGVSLVDADGSHAPEGVLLSLSPDDATPLAPAPQLVALGRIAPPTYGSWMFGHLGRTLAREGAALEHLSRYPPPGWVIHTLDG